MQDPKGDPVNTVEKHFSDYGIVAGVRVTVASKDTGIYPREYTGRVKTIYPMFVVVHTITGYYVTIHLSDLICSVVHILIHGRVAAVVQVATAASPWREEDHHADQALVSAGL